MTATAFLWGAATAGHQVEGNNVNADIWLLEQVPGTSFLVPSGDACDSLHRWREDVGLVRSLGLNCYRFSVEWSRIEPTPGYFSTAWLDHYARIAAACREAGIAPVVTLSHFTSPRWFAQAGGWTQADAPMLFARYAERVTRRLAPWASHVVTFNEPNLPLMGRWSATPIADPGREGLDRMLAAATRACGSDRFDVWVYSRGEEAALANLLAGHRAARSAVKAVRADLPVGMSLALPDVQAVGTQSGVAAYRRHAEAPFFAAARDDDFLGVQTYGRLRLDAQAVVPPPADAERTQSGDEYYPWALAAAVTRAHAETGRPVLVTENGIATADDRQRARYIADALASLDTARTAGVPVIGYIHWSLLDNFEWRRGYAQRFGLVAVDRRTFRRTAKPSARRYAELVRARQA
ncbi:family 1 glycosylhydrolase [Sphingomonas sp. RP10(2022)]|uniref:Family 1 glycosylhydrolase n=1 Tax=Sphingomonas liriopis TaxID=2949094 RepID=A0A9X2HVI7_9SPHN|nr:family 1 glycosylhydrolase [Sphingomonas liriopis]MCP3734313.1 family 1 glycosylhydrolase [Sphingomonas liriopis]